MRVQKPSWEKGDRILCGSAGRALWENAPVFLTVGLWAFVWPQLIISQLSMSIQCLQSFHAAVCGMYREKQEASNFLLRKIKGEGWDCRDSPVNCLGRKCVDRVQILRTYHRNHLYWRRSSAIPTVGRGRDWRIPGTCRHRLIREPQVLEPPSYPLQKSKVPTCNLVAFPDFLSLVLSLTSWGSRLVSMA